MSRLQKKHRIPIFAFIGGLFGLFLYLSPGTAFMVSVFIITGMILHKFLPPGKRKFLVILFLVGITLRVSLVFVSHAYLARQSNYKFYWGLGQTLSLFGDSGYYTLRGWHLGRFIGGEELPQKLIKDLFDDYGGNNYLYVLAIFQFLFGYSPISSILLNCYFGCLTALLVFFTTEQLFNTYTAKIASVLVMFFPSLVIWSLSNLKDTFLIFITFLSLFLFYKFTSRRRLSYIVLLALCLVWMPGLRDRLLLLMGLIFLFTLFFIWRAAFIKKAAVIVGLIILTAMTWSVISPQLRTQMVHIANYHKGVYNTGGYVYSLMEPWYYQGRNVSSLTIPDFLAMIPKGLPHFLLEPFPWSIKSLSMLFSLPQMLVWYLAVIFCLSGTIFVVRARLKHAYVLIVYLALSCLYLSVTGGNIGTDFRHRDILTPVVLILAAAGFSKSQGKMTPDELDQKTGRA